MQSAGIDEPSASTSLERAGFEQVHQLGGITVYSHGRSQSLHFVAEARFEATPFEVQRALLDYEAHPRYIRRLAESRLVRQGPRMLAVYQRLSMPVVDDRDYTLEVRWGQRATIRWVTFRALPTGPPVPNGVVRVRHHSGSWRLEPVADGRATRARYETLMDLGGWIPLWMARSSAGEEVAQVIAQFSQMVAARRAAAVQPTAGRSDPAR